MANFRRGYYSTLGVNSVEVQSSLSIAMNEEPLNIVKLQKLCLWVRIPHSHRLIVWKVLLKIISNYKSSWKFKFQEEESLLTTMQKLYNLTDESADVLLVKAVLLQITNAKDPLELSKTLDHTPLHLLHLAKAFLGISMDMTEAFMLFRGFIQRTSANVDKQLADLLDLVKIHDYSLYQVLKVRKLDKCFMWFKTFYANVLPVVTLEGVWDIVIAGEESVLGFVGLSCLLSVKRKILVIDQKEFDDLIDNISNYIDADAVANTAVNLWERPILDRMNKDEIQTLPKG
jgi:hypothetical protein